MRFYMLPNRLLAGDDCKVLKKGILTCGRLLKNDSENTGYDVDQVALRQNDPDGLMCDGRQLHASYTVEIFKKNL